MLILGGLPLGWLQEELLANPATVTTWAQLQTVLNDVVSGETIVLGNDVQDSADAGDVGLAFGADKAVTIDLNGHQIDRHVDQGPGSAINDGM